MTAKQNTNRSAYHFVVLVWQSQKPLKLQINNVKDISLGRTDDF